ncbi:MAG: phosphate ABC transporter permease subunit PstC [Oligoflexus sp.]
MIWLKVNFSSPSSIDRLFFGGLCLLAFLTATIVLLIALYLGRESWLILEHAGLSSFVMDSSWSPSEDSYQLMPMVVASLLIMFGSTLIATPLGILAALFGHGRANSRLALIYRRLMELLAGIPSVVYGFWGLVVLVPWINTFQAPGASLLAGILIVALMILPTIALTAESSFANVPQKYLVAAAALGLPRLATLRLAIWPHAKSGVIAGVLLAAGRAIGETMAVLMVCGNIVQLPQSIFMPVRSLTANIALEMAYAMDHHRSALFFSGLVLVALVLLLVFLAGLVKRESTHVY